MSSQPLILERTYQSSIKNVWEALTDKDQMKVWYFDLDEFKPVVGFEFQFFGGSEDQQFLHMCKIVAVDPYVKLAYSWRYEGYPGQSVVTFELFEVGENETRLTLKHTGLESFPQNMENFSVNNFEEGWKFILGESLLNYIDKEMFTTSILIKSLPGTIWQILLHPNNQWGKAFGGGASIETDWREGSAVVWRDIEGNIGANGIIIKHHVNEYMQIDFYDEVAPSLNESLGSYSEKFKLTKKDENECVLQINIGLLSKKDVLFHSQMWNEALEIIKNLSENNQK